MILSRESKKQIIFRVANYVRNLLGDEYINISDDEFQEAVYYNLSEYLQDDLEIYELIKEVLQEKEIEIEEVQEPREEETILSEYYECVTTGDDIGMIHLQNEYIKLLQRENDYLGTEIMNLWRKINVLLKQI